MKNHSCLNFISVGIVVAVVTLCSSTSIKSQAPSPTISGEDAVTLLTKAGELSNLQTDSTPPFHLVATIETFDFTGQPDGDGTIEEFWDGSRLRRSIAYRGATQVRVTAGQNYVSTEPFASSWPLRTLLQSVLNPMPSNPKLPSLVAEGKKLKLAGVDADCIAVTFRVPSSKSPTNSPSMPVNHDTYCMSADRHILRLVSTSDGATLIYNNLETFGPRAVAQDITLKRVDAVRGKLHIKSISTWKPDDATFEAVAGSVSFPTNDNHDPGMPGRVVAGSRISGDQPIYPPAAKAQHISGEVVLSAIISRTGTVQDIDVISSPNKDLAKAAVDSVRTSRYKPYLLNDQPVEVNTTLTIHFSFGS